MLRHAQGSVDTVIDSAQLERIVAGILEEMGPLRRVLLVPPDYTRLDSAAGEISAIAYRLLHERAHVELLPALGTHAPMSEEQLDRMFPGVPPARFRVHDWRKGVRHLGTVPAETMSDISEGRLDCTLRCEINRLLLDGDWDRILSIGQLIPHEVAGIANHSKNIFVGVGGKDNIDKSHFLGAVYGMERMMGRADTPVRRLLDHMARSFIAELPISYIMTVRGRDADGGLVTRGLFAGDDAECFRAGAQLCRQVNLDRLDRPIRRAVVYLRPDEFHSTWLGNKAIYRTRMALADDAELIVLAPGVKCFGEDPGIDRLIRRHGYRGTETVLRAVDESPELAGNLSAAAHLIHGSSEGRFRVVYCPGGLSRDEIESVGFDYADPGVMLRRYDPERLRGGWQRDGDGSEFFYVENPAQGLWGLEGRA